MNIDSQLNKVIPQIVKNYPDDDWVQEIKKRVPDADTGMIQEYIMIYFGGDVVAVND